MVQASGPAVPNRLDEPPTPAEAAYRPHRETVPPTTTIYRPSRSPERHANSPTGRRARRSSNRREMERRACPCCGGKTRSLPHRPERPPLRTPPAQLQPSFGERAPRTVRRPARSGAEPSGGQQAISMPRPARRRPRALLRPAMPASPVFHTGQPESGVSPAEAALSRTLNYKPMSPVRPQDILTPGRSAPPSQTSKTSAFSARDNKLRFDDEPGSE